jgi:hypothetical protein
VPSMIARAINPVASGWHGQALRLAGGFFAMAVIMFCTSCSSPSSANIELRKEKQNLEDKIAELNRVHAADQATIQSLQNKIGTLPTLPQNRLDQLFTVHGLELGRLTGGVDLDPAKPGDEGIRVYATPTDDDSEPLKAAGTFIIEAFDLTAKTPEIGKWTFDLATTRKTWIGNLLAHNFVLNCPWQQIPQHQELTIKVTFLDQLTQREFHAQTVVKVKLPSPAPPAVGLK